MKLLVAGDLFVSQPEAIKLDSSILALFSSCDYRIVNFEGPVIGSNYSNLPAKSGPRLMQPGTVVELLRELHVDALTLANNHIMDQGKDGFNKTIDALRGFTLIGAGTWDEAYRMVVIEHDGLRVGLLNFCECQFGVLTDEWVQRHDEIGCAWVNHPRVDQLILESKRQVDCLVAIVHAGVEMIDVPLPEWRDRYREMINLGSSAVIAHHPHVGQGYEIYKGKPIAYSLGNFCFIGGVNPPTEKWTIGALALLNICEEGVSISMVGCQQQKSSLSLLDDVRWKLSMSELCILLEEGNYVKYIDEKCSRMLKDYWTLFAMGGMFVPEAMSLKNMLRIPLHRYDHVHLLNNLQCESHRWCIIRGLKTKNKY